MQSSLSINIIDEFAVLVFGVLARGGEEEILSFLVKPKYTRDKGVFSIVDSTNFIGQLPNKTLGIF